MNRATFPVLLLPAVFLASCASTGVTDSTADEGPVYGRQDVTSFVAGTDGSPVGVGDLSRIAKTVRKYKALGASDQDVVRRIASMKFDGLVASEMQRLAPQFEAKKATVRKKAQARVAEVRKKAAVRKAPPAEVEREVAQVQAEETAAVAKIDAEWKSAARAQVAKRYGTDFAIPVSNPEGKAVVAFASVRDTSVSVSAASYEVVGTDRQLTAAASAGRKVSHEGRDYELLDAQVALR